jgi:hypothetical protein
MGAVKSRAQEEMSFQEGTAFTKNCQHFIGFSRHSAETGKGKAPCEAGN